MIDLFGTPYTKALHMVERYRLRDYDDVKDAIERNKKENWLFAGDVFSGHRGKFLQLELTIEDKVSSRPRGPRRLLTYRGPARGQRLSVLKTPVNIITTAATPTFRVLISRTSDPTRRTCLGRNLWKFMSGLARLSGNSSTVVLTAFYSSPVRG